MTRYQIHANGLIVYSDECGGADELEDAYTLTYDLCESDRQMMELDEQVDRPCQQSVNACIENRITELGESRGSAKDFCFLQPLTIDPNFKGPCPAYLEEFESPAYDGDEWLLERAYIRLGFKKYIDDDEKVFRQRDTAQRLRKLLKKEPDNLVALGLLSVLYDENGVVETLNLEIKRYELERDCGKHWIWTPTWMYNHLDTLIDN